MKIESSADPYSVEIEEFLARNNLSKVVESWSLPQDPRIPLEINRCISAVWTLLGQIAQQVHQTAEAHAPKIVAAIKHERKSLERVQRRNAFLNPHSSQELEAALYWLVEQGSDKDLMFLSRIPEPWQLPLKPPTSAETSPQSICKQWTNELQRINRRWDLRFPPSFDVFVNTLKWMVEQGDLEELDLLHQVRAKPPYNSEQIQRLFEIAEERIHDRVYNPQTVVDREEAAYQEHRSEWDETYAGEFIAIHRGQVVDHDTDKHRLIRRLNQRQREIGRFSAYIVQIGAPVYSIKGPARGRHGTPSGG